MRALWKGNIILGSSSLPVKFYTAVRQEKIKFHLLHDEDKARLRQEMVCPLDRARVEPAHIVKGFEIEEDSYVLVTKEELERFKPVPSRNIEILQFISEKEIDPRYFEHFHYLGPDGSDSAFISLHAALSKTGRAGVCRWVMRQKEHYGLLKTHGSILTMVILRKAGEVMPVGDLPLKESTLTEKEMQTARYLIGIMGAKLRLEDYRDGYQEKLKQLIGQKAAGIKIPLRAPVKEKAAPRKELLYILEASVKAAEAKRTAGKRAKEKVPA